MGQVLSIPVLVAGFFCYPRHMIYEEAAKIRNETIHIRSQLRKWADHDITTVKPPPSQEKYNPHTWRVDFDDPIEAEKAMLFYRGANCLAAQGLELLIAHQRKRGIER